MQKTLITVLILFLASSVSAASLTVEVLDQNGDRLNADFELRQDGTQINESSGLLEATLNEGENYTLIQENMQGIDATIYNFSISQDLDLKPRIYKERPEENFLTDTDPIYFIDQSFDFSQAEIRAERNQPDSIAKCLSINNAECTDWQVNSTSEYPSSYENSVFSYNVTDFSGYTTGEKAPKPEIQNIEIYNVSEAQDRRNNGELVGEGLNKTFTLKQKESTDYRFEFNVTNNGSETWVLTADDTLKHNGLNRSWSVNETEDIYYRVNDSIKEGGTSSSGEIRWNTGNGGEIAVGESLSAEYLVNATQDSTNTFNQYFNASTTAGTSDQNYHDLKALVLGFLDVSIDYPANESVVQDNREFTLNGTVDCIEGDCGEVTAEPRQNESTGQEAFTGEEFEVLSANDTCTLFKGDRCTVNWSINATADLDTFHKLDFLTSSNYSLVEGKETLDSIVEVRDILMIDLDWNVVDFGVLDPGEEKIPAKNNSGGYNLMVEEDSNKVDNLWLKASPLISKENSNYTIQPGNMKWSEQNSYSSLTNFTSNYSLLDSELDPGTTKTLYYWLNVPYGITSGVYTGTMTFKANQTQ